MKITFEGISIYDVAEQMVGFLDGMETGKSPIAVAPVAEVPAPAPKSKAKVGGLGNAQDVADRMAKARAARGKPKAKPVEKTVEKVVEKAAEKQAEKPPSLDDIVLETPEEPVIDMTKLTALRVKTTEDLQAAYSNGKHKQVLELLSTYGNGAKSFRELAIKDFIPIRKAIDDGALQ